MLVEQDEDRNLNSDEENDDNVSSVSRATHRIHTPKFSLAFSDVQGLIRPFDGDDGFPIKRWITEFEETAVLMDWNDLQCLVFAKRSLTGFAKLHIQGEKGITSWSLLKKS